MLKAKSLALASDNVTLTVLSEMHIQQHGMSEPFDKCRICVVGIVAVQLHLYSVNCTGYRFKMRTGVLLGYCHYFSNMLEQGHLQKMNAICVCTATLNQPWG